MLAAQFLNVVIEEDAKQNDSSAVKEVDVSDSENSTKEMFAELLSKLDIKAKLASILLSECVIEPSEVAMKREKPVLRFEADVTPIYNEPPLKKSKQSDEFSILTSVEAVYSDNEEMEEDGNGNLLCPVCNRRFARNCSLALHMKSHEGTSEEVIGHYKCHVCTKSFLQRSLLLKHLAETHGFHREEGSMLRTYQCQFCGKSYSQKSVLKKHLVVHTGERERCKICGAGFSQRSSLVRHAKRIHSGLVSHALGGVLPGVNSNGLAPGQQVITTSGRHNTPVLTTALSNVTHPTLGTPLIVNIPLNHLAAGKYAGTQLASAAIVSAVSAHNLQAYGAVRLPQVKQVLKTANSQQLTAALNRPALSPVPKVILPSSGQPFPRPVYLIGVKDPGQINRSITELEPKKSENEKSESDTSLPGEQRDTEECKEEEPTEKY